MKKQNGGPSGSDTVGVLENIAAATFRAFAAGNKEWLRIFEVNGHSTDFEFEI